MKHAIRALAFALLPLLAVLPLAATAQTQAPAPKSATSVPAPSARKDQTIQRIHTEDAGSRIDELRVGGETEKITVQPKTSVPPYEVKPAESARGKAPAAANGDTNGSRVWNVLKF